MIKPEIYRKIKACQIGEWVPNPPTGEDLPKISTMGILTPWGFCLPRHSQAHRLLGVESIADIGNDQNFQRGGIFVQGGIFWFFGQGGIYPLK